MSIDVNCLWHESYVMEVIFVNMVCVQEHIESI